MIRAEQLVTKHGPAVGATMSQPLDHLVACHRRIEERLEGLERAARHLEDRHEEALEVIGNCFRFLTSNGAWHTADEEESVFPRLVGRMTDEESRFLRDLEREHRDVETLLEDLKNLHPLLAVRGGDQEGTARRFRQGAATLCSAYRGHIAAEDERLIPLAKRILRETELSVLSREMRARRGLAVEAGPEASDPL